MFAKRLVQRTASVSQKRSLWSYLEPIQLDQTKQVAMAFKKDTSPNKISLGEGIYADNNGKTAPVLPSVQEVYYYFFLQLHFFRPRSVLSNKIFPMTMHQSVVWHHSVIWYKNSNLVNNPKPCNLAEYVNNVFTIFL